MIWPERAQAVLKRAYRLEEAAEDCQEADTTV